MGIKMLKYSGIIKEMIIEEIYVQEIDFDFACFVVN